MTIPEGNPADLVEQAQPATRGGAPDDGGLPSEASEADAAEQATPAGAGDAGPAAHDLPLESDELDAAEQDRVVELDEDEYR
jgi:hypothetical protein